VDSIEVTDNIFFNDYAGSGRTIDASQFLVIKNSYGNRPAGSEHVNIRRNVFLNYEGAQSGAFVRYGEDGGTQIEAARCILENNLFVGNNTQRIQSPINSNLGNRSVDILVRNNTLVGAFPHTLAHSLLAHGQGWLVYNNIWSCPGGAMGEWGDGVNTASVLNNNLYWNNGSAIPGGSGTLQPANDTRAILTNPRLADPTSGTVVLPRLNGRSGTFISGSTSIRQEFLRLANLYAPLETGSGALNAALAAQAPADDILGNTRGAQPDIGCFEVGGIPSADEALSPLPGLQLSSSPNPFTGRTVVTALLPAPGRVRVSIWDIHGRLQAVVAEGNYAAGRHQFSWDAGRSPAGVYVMRFTWNGHAFTRRMLRN
jgi:hypothetical protein